MFEFIVFSFFILWLLSRRITLTIPSVSALLSKFFPSLTTRVALPLKDTMSDILCCNQATPYRPQHLQHERKFKSVLAWVRVQRTCSDINDFNVQAVLQTPAARVFQVVKQVNYGPLESKRYFVTLSDSTAHYHEITEHDLIDANYKKLNR